MKRKSYGPLALSKFNLRVYQETLLFLNEFITLFSSLKVAVHNRHFNAYYGVKKKTPDTYRDIFLTLNIVHTYSLCSILKNTDHCIVSCYATNYTEHQRF
jgi:hypothetical protein